VSLRNLKPEALSTGINEWRKRPLQRALMSPVPAAESLRNPTTVPVTLVQAAAAVRLPMLRVSRLRPAAPAARARERLGDRPGIMTHDDAGAGGGGVPVTVAVAPGPIQFAE
jgi:hypothetical protein